MERTPELEEILALIRKEHRHTQLVFGVSIIVLSLVLMVIAPVVIRSAIPDTLQGPDYAMDPGARWNTGSSTKHSDTQYQAHDAMMASSTITAPTGGTK